MLEEMDENLLAPGEALGSFQRWSCAALLEGEDGEGRRVVLRLLA